MQDRALWLVASAAGILLLAAALVPEEDSPEAEAAPTPVTALDGDFRVSVLNGCGAPQVAARMTRRARALGIDVIHEGNASSFGFLQSVVVDRSGDLDRARAVAALLGIPHTVQQISNDPYRLEDVAVIVGRDYQRLDLLEPQASQP